MSNPNWLEGFKLMLPTHQDQEGQQIVPRSICAKNFKLVQFATQLSIKILCLTTAADIINLSTQ